MKDRIGKKKTTKNREVWDGCKENASVPKGQPSSKIPVGGEWKNIPAKLKSWGVKGDLVWPLWGFFLGIVVPGKSWD